jgi:hypothetical protein
MQGDTLAFERYVDCMTGPCRVVGMALETDYKPALDCSCGFTAVGNDWSEAGEIMDDHLAEK